MDSQSESDSPLHSAVRSGQYEELRKLLGELDVDVNCINSYHETPILLACALGQQSIIELLITFGANVFIKDCNGKDCYDRMAGHDIYNLVNKLSFSHDFLCPTLTSSNTWLHDAVKLRQSETMQDVLQQKAMGIDDKNSAHETPLHLACAIGHDGIVHMLVINGASMYAKDSYNNAPVHRAASKGHINVVDMLITKFGCDPTIRGYQGRSLLHFACASGNIKLVEILVQRKVLNPVSDRDACGLTPLHIASLCGHKEVLSMLIVKLNCDIECKSGGAETPLHLACINGHTNAVKLLVLEHKADLYAHNCRKNLPLHLAATFGHIDVIKALVYDCNSDPSKKGRKGRTILHTACVYGQLKLAETLIADFGLDLMDLDEDKNTPLHSAAMDGWLSQYH